MRTNFRRQAVSMFFCFLKQKRKEKRRRKIKRKNERKTQRSMEKGGKIDPRRTEEQKGTKEVVARGFPPTHACKQTEAHEVSMQIDHNMRAGLAAATRGCFCL
jgi:hypothetical protein